MDAISLFKRLSLYMHEDALCFAGVNQAGSDIGVTNSRLSMSSVGKSRDGLILHGAVQTLSCSDMVKSEVRRTSRHAQHRKNTAMCEAHNLACAMNDKQVGLAFNTAHLPTYALIHGPTGGIHAAADFRPTIRAQRQQLLYAARFERGCVVQCQV